MHLNMLIPFILFTFFILTSLIKTYNIFSIKKALINSVFFLSFSGNSLLDFSDIRSWILLFCCASFTYRRNFGKENLFTNTIDEESNFTEEEKDFIIEKANKVQKEGREVLTFPVEGRGNMLCKEIRSNVETYYVEVKNNKGLDDVSRWVNSNRGR